MTSEGEAIKNKVSVCYYTLFSIVSCGRHLKDCLLEHVESNLLVLQVSVLKVSIHCEGCKKKVYKILSKIKGRKKKELNLLFDFFILSGFI